MMFRRFGLATALSACLAATPLVAQESPNMLVVLDASGSMWGQIDGRTKIELAREALSGVLSEASPGMQIGLMAYGHRQRGQCGDIEMLVPMGPAMSTVPQIIDRANAINPRGMTPIVDSVMQAAQSLRFSEQAATVVLLTDGIETCGGDPCALGRMLAAEGIDFTAHVVGFDMTDAEQRTVACLADETGGLFVAANDAESLGRALRETILAVPDPVPAPEPQPVAGPRTVEFYLRDTVGGEVLTGRVLEGVNFLPYQTDAPGPVDISLSANPGSWTLAGSFLPGTYEIQILRRTSDRQPLRAVLAFEVPPGEGVHRVDLVIASRLRLTALAHAGLPMPAGSGNLPFATYGSGAGRAVFAIHPIVNGAIDPSIDYGGVNNLNLALPPGDYFIRGELAQTFLREKLVRLAPGETTDFTFDFEAARVFVALVDGQGRQTTQQRVRFHDGPRETAFANGGGGPKDGDWMPFYLPQGTWRIHSFDDRGGSKAVAEGSVTVPGAGQDIRVDLRDGDRDMAETARQCLAYSANGERCFVETVTPARIDRELPGPGTSAGGVEPVSFTGTWDVEDRMMTLVQEGRRVWGEVRPKGNRTVRRLYGEVAADGMTLRGTIQGVGIVELRLSPDGLGLSGGSSHFGGGDTGIRVALALNNARYTGRKLSAGVPPLAEADGTEADLHPAFRGGAVAAFEAFMAPVRTPAPAGTEGNIAAMQALAQPVTFGGAWNSQHGFLQFQQDGRRVWGERDQGVMEGELSPDGLTLRGTWTNANGRWGLFEFVLDPGMDRFTGAWGQDLDTDLKAGRWTGERASWLAAQPERATRDGTRAQGASGPAFEAFMEAVRGPDLAPPPGPGDLPSPGPVAGPVVGGNGFEPRVRYDYTHPDGRPAVSFVFGAAIEDPEIEIYRYYTPGYALMHLGWCGGAYCPVAEVYPVGGRTLDEVPNTRERLEKGGVFPALDLMPQGIAVFEGDDSAWPDLGVLVHILAEPFESGRQLGNGDLQVLRTYGPFIGGQVEPATLAGFGALPGSGGAAPLPSPEPQPDPMPPIGGIEVMPRGVFAAMDVEPGQTVQEAMASLMVAPLDMMVQAQCSTGPTVIHDDGLIADRALRMGQRADINALFETTAYRICDQAGPVLFCDGFDAPLGPTPRAPDYSFRAEVVPGPQGTFATYSYDPAVPSRVYRSCLDPVDLAGSAEPVPDGRTRLAHMLDREDQPRQMGAADPVQGGGASGGVSGGLLDFAQLQGLWGDASSGDPGSACLRTPILVLADGRIGVWGGDSNGTDRMLASMACRTDGRCDLLSTNLPPDRMPQSLSLVARGNGLGLCADGNCMTLESCPMAAVPVGVEAKLRAALEAGGASGGGQTGGGQTAMAEVPAFQLPPGIWLADFEPEGQGYRPGSAELVAACYETPTIAYPDSTTISLELRDEAAGPAYSAVFTESCKPSGDAVWPLKCLAEDANVADPVAAVFESQTQLFARSAQLYRQVSRSEDGYTSEMFWHDCQRGDGARMDLGTDPLGPLLETTARELRGPALTPEPILLPQPTNDPAPAPVLIAEVPAPRLPMGIWVPGFEGDPQFPAPGSAAFRDLCYESPVVVAADGSSTGYMLQEEAAGPVYVATGTESCQPSGDVTWPLACVLEDAFVGDPSAALVRARGQLYAREDGTYRSLRDYSDGLREDLIWQACIRTDGRGINLATDPLGPLLSQAAAGGGQGAAPMPAPEPAPEPAPNPAPMPDPVQGGQLAPPPDMRLALNGLWFPRLDGRPLASWSAAERQEACRKTPGFMHADGLFIAFETQPGDYVPSANAHFRCGEDLSCAFHPGAPSAGQGATLVGNMELLPDGDARICLDGLCFGLSRCAMPDWTAAERGIGLDREWEARVTGRN